VETVREFYLPYACKEVDSEFMQELLKILCIIKLSSTSHKPSMRSATEVCHKVFNSSQSKDVSETLRDWSKFVSYIVLCYDATIHLAPTFARQVKYLVGTKDFKLGDWNMKEISVPQHVDLVLKRLKLAYGKTRERLKQTAESVSRRYNR
jgi:hypothetical protein